MSKEELINQIIAIIGSDDNGKTLGKNASLAFLNKKAKLYENREGWRLIGMLKKMLDDNNIDVVAKMKEWRK